MPVRQSIIILLAFPAGFVIAGVLRSLPNFLPDIPNSRSLHQRTVPRGGGISFILPFLAVMIYMAFRDELSIGLIWLGVAASMIALLGLLDDIFRLSALGRLTAQVLIVLAACYFGTTPELELFNRIRLEGLVVLMIQTLWILVCINFFNFMDGMDGLVTIQSIFWAVAIGLILSLAAPSINLDTKGISPLNPTHINAAILLFFCLAAGLAGFLFWNRPQASIFMGDVGSCFLGFVFGYAAIILPFRATAPFSLAEIRWMPNGANPIIPFSVFLILLSPFLLDAGLTIVRRLIAGTNILNPHKEHIYQRLVSSGCSAWKVNGLFVLWNLFSLIPVYAVLSVHVSATLTALAIAALFLGGIYLHSFTLSKLAHLHENQER